MKAEDWDRRYDSKELVWSAEPNQFLPPEVEDLPRGRSIDLACGEGRNAIWLAEQGWESTGLDFSPVALTKARQISESRDVVVDWICEDVTRWDPSGPSWDLVCVFYLQLPEPLLVDVLAAAAGALRPGGTLLGVGHDLDNLEHGHGGPPMPEVLWTIDPIVESLEGADAVVDIERAEQVDRFVDSPDGPLRAIDCLVRARRR